MIEAALVALILASPSITNLVVGRIVPAGKPQALAYPYLTYAIVSDIEITHTNDGRGDLREARVQFDCWGSTLLQANQLAAALMKVLSPRRQPSEPWVPLWITPTCRVQNGREAQRITFAETDVPIPDTPGACAQRIAYDFRFQYHLTE